MRREVRLLVEFLVVERHGMAAQRRRRRDQRRGDAGAAQVRGVGVDHLPPVRVEVGLARDDHRDRADLQGLPHERHLGFGELLAGVADHQHRVRVGQQAQRRRQVRLTVAADARGVDERQAAFEQWAGRASPRARSTSRPPACGARRRSSRRSATGISIRSGSSPSGRATTSRAEACSPYDTTVAITVDSSSADPCDRHVQQRIRAAGSCPA